MAKTICIRCRQEMKPNEVDDHRCSDAVSRLHFSTNPKLDRLIVLANNVAVNQ